MPDLYNHHQSPLLLAYNWEVSRPGMTVHRDESQARYYNLQATVSLLQRRLLSCERLGQWTKRIATAKEGDREGQETGHAVDEEEIKANPRAPHKLTVSSCRFGCPEGTGTLLWQCCELQMRPAAQSKKGTI